MTDEKTERRPLIGYTGERHNGRFTKDQRPPFEIPAELLKNLHAFADALRSENPNAAVRAGLARRLVYAEMVCNLLSADLQSKGALTANGATRATTRELQKWTAIYSRLAEQYREIPAQ